MKSVGIRSATRTAIESALQLLRRGIKLGRTQGSSVAALPSLRGAPLQWDMTVRNLLALRDYHRNNATALDVLSIHRRLKTLIARSGNRPSEARVTVLIPAFDQLAELAICIESIFSFPSSTHLRIVVGDDASPNIDLRVLNGLPGVTIIRHSNNLGYIQNVNVLARNATTELILTLNQDVVTAPGWIDELVADLDSRPNCGVVGPRILDHNFKILEAGAILFKDAFAAHRGRGCAPEDPRYNFSTTVDYLSGCALLTRRELWNQLNGLNENLTPAYYDDVDFCLRVQELGLEIRYAPLSCVIHFEGTSMGSDEDDRTSLKHYQVINREKLSVLFPSLASRSAITDLPWPDSHLPSMERATCVLDGVPNPQRDGGAVDFVLIIEYLLELNFHVTLVFSSISDGASLADWRSKGVRCQLLDDESTAELLSQSKVVFSFGIMVGVELTRRNFSHPCWIHHTSDCGTRRLEQMVKLERLDPIMPLDSRRWYAGLPRDPEEMWLIERQTMEKPSLCLMVSREDLEYCERRESLANLEYFPILKGFSEPDTQPLRPISRQTISFVGSFFHSPNPDAVEYFLADIWPLVRQQIPGATFLIWGSNISAEKTKEWSQVANVYVRGWFADWDDVIAETRTFVSPIRFGAGMKHKVIQSILLGRPVIGTRNSFDGLDQNLLSNRFVSDVPSEIADLLIGTLTSDDLWRHALNCASVAVGNGFYRSTERERVRQLIQNITD